MNTPRLAKFCYAAVPYAEWLGKACSRFDIADGPRFQMFIAHAYVETQGFTRMRESMRYTTLDALWRAFRSRFDLDADKIFDPEEKARAESYLDVPERLANLVYANRFGNRGEESGDGYAYRGGGGIHLTFADAYKAASFAVFGDDRLWRDPDLIAKPEAAMLTAAWFWSSRGCNEFADALDFEATTRRINPGLAGASDRAAAYVRAQQAFR